MRSVIWSSFRPASTATQRSSPLPTTAAPISQHDAPLPTTAAPISQHDACPTTALHASDPHRVPRTRTWTCCRRGATIRKRRVRRPRTSLCCNEVLLLSTILAPEASSAAGARDVATRHRVSIVDRHRLTVHRHRLTVHRHRTARRGRVSPITPETARPSTPPPSHQRSSSPCTSGTQRGTQRETHTQRGSPRSSPRTRDSHSRTKCSSRASSGSAACARWSSGVRPWSRQSQVSSRCVPQPN